MAEFKQSNNAYIVSIGNDEIEKIDIVQLGGRTMKQWYDKQENKPDYIINASLWDDGKNAIGTIWQNGELVRNEGTGYGFGISKSGGFGFGNPWDIAWNNYITGYPALIKDGKIMPDSVDSYVMTSKSKRSVIASAGNNIYLIATNEMTVAQLRKFLADNGYYNAINLDGGGSSRLMIGDKAVNSPTADRIIPNAICVWLKKNNKEDNNTMATKKVFLGAGHGGKDPGAVANNMEEADINLTMALACRDELVRHGVEVKMSRISDEDDPLTEEIAECNTYSPDLAIDIHTNAGGGDGFEVYHTIYGGTGKTLAENIEAEVIKAGQNSRGVKTRENSSGKDYYGFIRQTSCPAVICEIGFIDNKNDLKDFDEKAEQIKLGKAYAHGILKTLGVEIMTDTTQTPVQDETKHWAYKHYESLIANGVDLEETDFDGNITRGEAFALADKIVKALKA